MHIAYFLIQVWCTLLLIMCTQKWSTHHFTLSRHFLKGNVAWTAETTEIRRQTSISNDRKMANQNDLLISYVMCALLIVQIRSTLCLVVMTISRGRIEYQSTLSWMVLFRGHVAHSHLCCYVYLQIRPIHARAYRFTIALSVKYRVRAVRYRKHLYQSD